MTQLPSDCSHLGCTARPLLVVWEVEARDHSAGGVSDNEQTAETAMFETLDALPSGRGRVRYARLSVLGIGYQYGETLLTAYRKNGATVAVAGDAWESIP
ncbi:hypothetical protein DP939_36505 [Spongiactinospora rosea]|uniref:Uncharacterized protein n=1 Tax=Spongiactinospora rosea TaxID=2248750 RepID=A0A366LPV1_9ACTN|nr:hypothetical protein DP939_36505 [Spongiactinospora rosea]